MVGLYRTLSLKESKMGEHTYKTMTASDVYDAQMIGNCEPGTALGIIKADREFAKSRLENVVAESIKTVESLDYVVITIRKFREREN